ncbi:MAG: hypothetical protein ACOC9W_02515, partial [Persicimonas sp.]
MNSTIKRQLTACWVFLAALGFSTVASADQPAVELDEPMAMSTQHELIFELRGQTHYVDDDSFDALSDTSDYGGGMLGVGYGLGDVLPGLRGYLLYAGGDASTRRFDGAVDLNWERLLFMAAADWGPEFYGTVRPSVRLGAGYALQYLELETTGSPKDDYAHDLAGLASVGLEVYTPRGFFGRPKDFLNRLRLGLIGEFGYLTQTTATFDELDADGDDEWSRDQAAL